MSKIEDRYNMGEDGIEIYYIDLAVEKDDEENIKSFNEGVNTMREELFPRERGASFVTDEYIEELNNHLYFRNKYKILYNHIMLRKENKFIDEFDKFVLPPKIYNSMMRSIDNINDILATVYISEDLSDELNTELIYTTEEIKKSVFDLWLKILKEKYEYYNNKIKETLTPSNDEIYDYSFQESLKIKKEVPEKEDEKISINIDVKNMQNDTEEGEEKKCNEKIEYGEEAVATEAEEKYSEG